MKGSSNDNGKVSDSGYTNTCVGQSQKSSGSSLSRNSNRSSGYCGGHPSAFDSSNYALPKPISKRKAKEHKKKKSETSTAIGTDDRDIGKQIESKQQIDIRSYDALESSFHFRNLCKKSEEVARVESNDTTDLGEHTGDSNSTDPVGTKTNPLDDTTSNTNEGFCAVISLHNGLVIDTTTTLKTILGYTREEWFGRSFIEFVHPKDKSTFADHLAKNIALPYGYADNDLNGRQTSLFCCLRKHDEGTSATGSGSDGSNSVITNSSLYLPFHLTTSINYYRGQSDDNKTRMKLLTIVAQQLFHIYKTPEETIISTIFSIRHDPNCIVTHVDELVVQYLGYLPQDMIGRSLFDFYHPEDLPFIKDIYETVVKMEGLPFRSRPYRFATQNGGYVILETECSSFINPWREKLEFVVSRHRILTGPQNPDVFQQANGCQANLLANISEEVFKESKIIQAEIRALLHERIQTKDNIDAFQLSSRSKDLVTFVENLLQEVKPPALSSKDRTSSDNRSFSEPGGVMLGAISPHHDYSDSKDSTETPPSYHQLNYNEKIERFFESKPATAIPCVGSDEENPNSSDSSNKNNSSGPSTDANEKSSPHLTGTTNTTPNDGSGSGSGENFSSGSNNQTSSGSRDDGYTGGRGNTMQLKDLKPTSLTVSQLYTHNKNMEKLMAQQHKERRCTIKKNKLIKDSKPKGATKKSPEKSKDPAKNQANKRRNSQSPDEKRSKVARHEEHARTCTVAPVPCTGNSPANVMSGNNVQTVHDNITIWPSVPVTGPSQTPSPCCMASQNSGMQEASRCPVLPPIIPVYYIPMPRIRAEAVSSMHQPGMNQFQQSPYVSYAAPVATVVYPPIVCAPTQVSTMYRPFVQSATPSVYRETPQSNSGMNHPENASDRPESQMTTSIECQPSSIMAMSELSKKALAPGELVSYSVSFDGASTLVPNMKHETNTNSQFDSSLEDSSDSSFYGSFLNTSSDGSSVRPQNKKAAQETLWKPTKLSNEQRDSLRKEPLNQESVKMTTELIYQYQMKTKPLSEVLEADLKALKTFSQPQMVNEQLAQLYADMELVGKDAKFELIEGTSSSGSCNGDPMNIMSESKRQDRDSVMSMMYEENAPLPAP